MIRNNLFRLVFYKENKAFPRLWERAVILYLVSFHFINYAGASPFSEVKVVSEQNNMAYIFAVGLFFGVVIFVLLSFFMKKGLFAFSSADGLGNREKEFELSTALLNALYSLTQIVENRDKSLLSQKNSAEIANNAKNDFLINISHELRTPMHAIINFAEIGRSRINEVNKDKLLLYFSRIEESAERLLSLLNGMLDLTKLELGKANFNFTHNDIGKCVEDAIKEISSLAEKKKIRIKIENNLSKSIAVFDYQHIIQVVINLVSNALKFSPENKQIILEINRYAKDSKKICINITDQGSGVPEGEEEKIFEKFVQSSANEPGSGGSGLGLAICKEIVLAHGGEIWVENVSGGGAKFSFTMKTNN